VYALVGCSLALALASCGSQPSYREQASAACDQARHDAGTSAASAAAASRAALAKVRALHAPDGQKAAADGLVSGLSDQQRALDELAAALRAHAKPAELRDLAGTVDVRGNLIAPSAHKLGVPGCGRAGGALADRLLAEDYAVRMHRTVDYLGRVADELPSFTTSDRVQLDADAERAYKLVDDVSGRLQPLEPPRAVAPLHGAIVDVSYGLGAPFSNLQERIFKHRPADGVRALREFRAKLALLRKRWQRMQPKLPRVAADSIWGSPSGAVLEAAARKRIYVETLQPQLLLLNTSRFPSSASAGAAAWDRAGAKVARTLSSIRGARPPADATVANRLMLRGLGDMRDAFRSLAVALRTHDPAPAAKAQTRVTAGLDELRHAQRRFRAAGYRLDLGAGDGKVKPRRSAGARPATKS
jgi:hypothetical protein